MTCPDCKSERSARLANEQELRRADQIIGEERAKTASERESRLRAERERDRLEAWCKGLQEQVLAAEGNTRTAERERDEARRQVEGWYEAVSLHLTATKHAPPAAVNCEACETAEGGWCASCRPLAGLLTERHIARLAASDKPPFRPLDARPEEKK